MLSGHSIAASWADEMGGWTFSSKCPYCWFVSWPDWTRTETCGSISAQLAGAFVPLCRHGVLARGIAGLLTGEGWGEHTHTYTPREWLWQAGQIRFVVYCVYSGLCVCLVIGEQGRDAVWPWPEILSPIDYNLKRKADGTHCKMWQIHYLRFKIQYNKGTFKE